MTSGGSESILSAIKASRDYMRATRGITQPEMVIAVSAHAAYYKVVCCCVLTCQLPTIPMRPSCHMVCTQAAEYFNIRLVRVPVGKDFCLSGAAVRGALSRNTVVVVASAPGFPHGVVDHIADIAAITRRRGVCLHVDACLGGFVMPFARDLGTQHGHLCGVAIYACHRLPDTAL